MRLPNALLMVGIVVLSYACGGRETLNGETASPSPSSTYLSGRSCTFSVDRVWDDTKATSDAQGCNGDLPDAAYVSVKDGKVYQVSFSADGSSVSIQGEKLLAGTRVSSNDTRALYKLDAGTFAGGEFVVWTAGSGLQAELTIFGSGRPVIGSERGTLTCEACLAAGCGGSTPDQVPPDVVVTPPAAGSCAGSTKLEYQGTSVVPTAITSSLLIMDCCDGATFRLHTKEQLGFDLVAMLRMEATSGWFQPGHYAVSASGGPAAVNLARADDALEKWATAEGSLEVIAGGDYAKPTRLSFCVQVKQTGHALDGTRVFVADAGLMAPAGEQRFGLWLLKDPSINALDAAKMPLASLTLADYPVLDLVGVGYYEASTHHLGWAMPFGSSAESFRARLPKVPVQGLPFVLIANGERIYLGAFATALSSFLIPMPSVVVEETDFNGLTIDPAYPAGAPAPNDPRCDPRILGVLQDAFKLVP